MIFDSRYICYEAAAKAPEPAAPEPEVAESKKVSRKGYFNYMRDKK